MKWLYILTAFLGSFSIHLTASGQEINNWIRSNNFTDYKKDTATVGLLNKKGNQLSDIKSDSALYYYQQALILSEQRNFIAGKARTYHNIGIYYFRIKNYSNAIYYMDQAMQQYILANDKKNAIKHRVAITYYYTLEYNNIAALQYYRSTIGLFNTHDTAIAKDRAKMHDYAALAFSSMGDYDSAFYYYHLLIQELQPVNATNYDIIAAAYDGLGDIALRTYDYKKALSYFDKAAILANKYDNKELIAVTLHAKGIVYYEQRDFTKAKRSCLQALDLARKDSMYSYITSNCFFVSVILIEEDSLETALLYSKEAYNAAQKTKSYGDLINASYSLGCTYVKMKRYSLAEPYLLFALKLSKKNGILNNITNAYEQLSILYAGTGHYNKAYEYMKLYAYTRDSLRGKESTQRITQIETKFHVTEKDKEIAQKRLQLSQQSIKLREQNIWIIAISAGALLITLLLIGVYRSKRNKEKLHTVQIRYLEKENEVIELKSKMKGEEEERIRLARELHDGMVVQFSAIKMNLSVLPENHPTLVGAVDFNKIITNMDNATRDLRKTAHNMMPDILLQGGLSEAIYYFCKDLQESAGIPFDYQQYEELPRLQAESELFIYRIVQELLQNILKHAVATRILVQLSWDNDLLMITVEDNGKGFDINTINNDGIGLKNIRARITSLKGHIDIESHIGKGTSAHLEFDTREYKI